MRTKIMHLAVGALLATELPGAAAGPGSQAAPVLKPHLAGTITASKSTSSAIPHTLRLQVISVGQGKLALTGPGFLTHVVLARKDLSRDTRVASSDILYRLEVRFPAIPSQGQPVERIVSVTPPKKIVPGQYFWCLEMGPIKTVSEIMARDTIGCTPVQIAGGSPFTPRPKLPRSPSGAQPRKLLLNTLLINGSLVRVKLQGAESATITWSLPTGRDFDGIFLLVSSREFTGPCFSDGGSSGDSAYPDSGYHPGAPFGSHEMALDNPVYWSGKYYLKGCLWRGGAYTGDETNTVEVEYTNIFQAGGVVHCLAPPCKPELRVNENGNEVWVTPGEPPMFDWNLRRPAGPSLSVEVCEDFLEHDNPYLRRPMNCPTYYRISELPQGRGSFPLDSLEPGHTYDVRGSYVDPRRDVPGGPREPVVYSTNVVRLHYDWSQNVFPQFSRPNLSIGNIIDRGAGRVGADSLRRLEFTVRTRRWAFRSSTLRATYQFAVYLDEETTPRATGTIPSVHIAEGRDETVSVTHTAPDDEQPHLVRVVINIAGDIPERDYSDNTAVVEFHATDRSEGIRRRSANRIIDVRNVSEGPNWMELEVTYTSHGSESRLLVRPAWFSRPRIGLSVWHGRVRCYSGGESYYPVLRDTGGISEVGEVNPSMTRGIRFICRADNEFRTVPFPFSTSEVKVWILYGTTDKTSWPIAKRWVAGPPRDLPDLRLVYFEIDWHHRPTLFGNVVGSPRTVTVTVKNCGQSPSVASAVHVFKEVPRETEGLDVGEGWWWPYLYIGPLNPGQSETQTSTLRETHPTVDGGEWVQVRLDHRNEVIEGPYLGPPWLCSSGEDVVPGESLYTNEGRFQIRHAAFGSTSRDIYLDLRSLP